MTKRMDALESEKNNLLKNATLLNEKIQILNQNQSKVKNKEFKIIFYLFFRRIQTSLDQMKCF